MLSVNNLFHPYTYLSYVWPEAPSAVWIVLSQHELEAQEVARDLEALRKAIAITAPEAACLPDADSAIRSSVLNRVKKGQIGILTMSSHAFLQPAWSAESLARNSFQLRVDDNIERDELVRKLVNCGFNHVDTVEAVGDFTMRGQVLDFYPNTTDSPIRVLFAYDQIESLRSFDIVSQESSGDIHQVEVIPVKEEAGGSLLEFLAPKEIRIAAASSEALPEEVKAAFMSSSSIGVYVFYSKETDSKRYPVTAAGSTFAGNMPLFAREAKKLQSDGYQVRVVAPTPGEAERLVELMQAREAREEAPISLPVEIADLRAGFKDNEKKLWMVTSAEIFSKTAVKIWRPPVSKKPTRRGKKDFRDSLMELKLGDFVVHETYGIARYRGVQQVSDQEGIMQGEFLKLQFAKGDHLYVPVEDFHLVTKYASLASAQAPKLSSLDARSFERIKMRIREDVQKFCQELVELWAKRAAQGGFSFKEQTHWEEEFARSVPFDETDDQERAISEVLTDMESSVPMERLLLGDVGFGKTEVAMRAAFKAVNNDKQVVVLCPTTVLAEQHYRNFQRRFAPYPFRVGLFSRFVGKADIKKGLEELKRGLMDVAIGTIRLLQKDVVFKDIGLVIIDEEHRFGVAAKERLRFIASQVDTLYLSATPIPRTLSSALTGYKQISVIETPPVGRLPIETLVGPWDEKTIIRALKYELSRGGQAFYVMNEIQKLPQIAKELETMIPGLRTATCHGQMSANQIEEVMHKFLQGDVDVLVASSIIESGLDIPTVNTLIIEEAQDFGLSELYQLRGRVGRSNVRSYAYFFYPRGKAWDDLAYNAKERLSALEEFAELGSGMRLALRDLEIRGAGEFLGIKQHGRVSRVGLELFTKLMNEEMEKIREKAKGKKHEDMGAFPKMHLSLAAFIPKDFMPSEPERVAYYRRLSRSESDEELNGVFKELEDRCGKLPLEMERLRLLLKLRLLARKAGLANVDEKGNGVYQFELRKEKAPRETWLKWLLKEYGQRLRFVKQGEAFQIFGIASFEDLEKLLTKFIDFRV